MPHLRKSLPVEEAGVKLVCGRCFLLLPADGAIPLPPHPRRHPGFHVPSSVHSCIKTHVCCIICHTAAALVAAAYGGSLSDVLTETSTDVRAARRDLRLNWRTSLRSPPAGAAEAVLLSSSGRAGFPRRSCLPGADDGSRSGHCSSSSAVMGWTPVDASRRTRRLELSKRGGGSRGRLERERGGEPAAGDGFEAPALCRSQRMRR